MARISNVMLACLNALTILVAISAIAFSLWFQARSESPCHHVLKTPLLAVGAALLAVSAAGLAAAWCGVSILLCIYVFALFALIVAVIAFTVFAIIVSNQGVGRGTAGIGDYSSWLQSSVVNRKNWAEIKRCFVDAKLCESVTMGKGRKFYEHSLSPVMSGCCKPPLNCRFKPLNATSKTGRPMPDDPDCKAWSNIRTELCFECESCKTAILYGIKSEWRVLVVVNICILVAVVAIYSIGCFARRNNQFGKERQKGGIAD